MKVYCEDCMNYDEEYTMCYIETGGTDPIHKLCKPTLDPYEANKDNNCKHHNKRTPEKTRREREARIKRRKKELNYDVTYPASVEWVIANMPIKLKIKTFITGKLSYADEWVIRLLIDNKAPKEIQAVFFFDASILNVVRDIIQQKGKKN